MLDGDTLLSGHIFAFQYLANGKSFLKVVLLFVQLQSICTRRSANLIEPGASGTTPEIMYIAMRIKF